MCDRTLLLSYRKSVGTGIPARPAERSSAQLPELMEALSTFGVSGLRAVRSPRAIFNSEALFDSYYASRYRRSIHSPQHLRLRRHVVPQRHGHRDGVLD